MDDTVSDLKQKVGHNLQVIKARDEEINELEGRLKQAEEYLLKVEASTSQDIQDFEERVVSLEDKLGLRVLEIKDLRENNASLKNELRYYKKGYVDEISAYKKTIEDLKQQSQEGLELMKSEKVKMNQDFGLKMEKDVEEIKLQNQQNLEDLRSSLVQQIEDLNSELESKSKELRDTSKDRFKLQNELDNQKLIQETLEKKVGLLQSELSSTTTGDFRNMLEIKMELQKELAIKEHQLLEKNLKVEKLESKIKSLKSKFNVTINAVQKDYEDKTLEMVVEYRKEINDAEKVILNFESENSNLKNDLKELSSKVLENEVNLQQAGEHLQDNVEMTERKYREQIQKMRNDVEVLDSKLKNSQNKAYQLQAANKELLDKFSSSRMHILEVEKENTLLLDKVVELKEALLETEDLNGHQRSLETPRTNQKDLDPIGEAPLETSVIEDDDYLDHHQDRQGNRGQRESVEHGNDPLRASEELLLMNSSIPSLLQSGKFKIGNNSKYLLGRSSKKMNRTGGQQDAEFDAGISQVIEEMRKDMERAKEEVQQNAEKVKFLKDENSELLQKYKEATERELKARQDILVLKESSQLKSSGDRDLKKIIEAKENEVLELQNKVQTLKEQLTQNKDEFEEIKKEKDEAIETLEQEQEELLQNLSKTRAKMIKFRDSYQHNPDQDSIDMVLAEVDQLRIEKEQLLSDLAKKSEEVQRLRKNLAKYIYRGPKKKMKAGSEVGDNRDKSFPTRTNIRNFNDKGEEEEDFMSDAEDPITINRGRSDI